MSRAVDKLDPIVPKKFFRYVLKGAHFYNNQNRKSFTMNELVSFAYLKNQRMDRLEIVGTMVKRAVEVFKAHELLVEARYGRFHMNRYIAHQNDATPSTIAQEEAAASSNFQISEELPPASSVEPPAVSAQPRLDEGLPDSKDEKFTVNPLKRKISNASEDSSSDTEEPSNLGGKQPSFSKLLKRRKGTAVVLPKYKQNSTEPEAEPEMDLALVADFIPLEMKGKATAQINYNFDQAHAMPKLSDNTAKNGFEIVYIGSEEDDSD